MISGHFSATITKLLSPSRRISPIRSFGKILYMEWFLKEVRR